MATQADITAGLAYLTAVYQSWTIGPEVVAVWLDALQDLDGRDVIDACRQHVKGDISGRYPIPGKIRDLAIDARRVRAMKTTALPAHEKPPATPEQIHRHARRAQALINMTPEQYRAYQSKKLQDPDKAYRELVDDEDDPSPTKLDFTNVLDSLWKK
jgi:hypothetical protein